MLKVGGNAKLSSSVGGNAKLSSSEQVLARAFIKRHVHVPKCTWRMWIIKSELLLSRTRTPAVLGFFR